MATTGLMLPFLVESALVSYREITQPPGLKTPDAVPIKAPLPSLYTSAIIVYGGLALLPSSMSPIPQLVGWGFVIATLLNLYSPNAANNAAAANAAAAKALTTAPGTNPQKPTNVPGLGAPPPK